MDKIRGVPIDRNLSGFFLMPILDSKVPAQS